MYHFLLSVIYLIVLSLSFLSLFFFFFNNPPTPEIYPLPLPAALPILPQGVEVELDAAGRPTVVRNGDPQKRDEGRRVEVPGEIWRTDDEWGGQPISRLCIEAILEG